MNKSTDEKIGMLLIAIKVLSSDEFILTEGEFKKGNGLLRDWYVYHEDLLGMLQNTIDTYNKTVTEGFLNLHTQEFKSNSKRNNR